MTTVVFISILASLGAAAVAWGLYLESFKEKPEFRDVEDFRSSARKAHCGQKWVFWGVIAEMVIGFCIAIWEGNELIKTDSKIANADARNLPINSISGYGRIIVRPKQGSETQFAMNLPQAFPNSELQYSDSDINKGETVLFIFGKSPKNEPQNGAVKMGLVAQVVFVGTLFGEGIAVRKSKPYVPNICFDMRFDSGSLSNPSDVTFNELKCVEIEGLGEGKTVLPLEIVGGKFVLFVNKNWPKTFLIPPQTNQFWRASSFETNGHFIAVGYGPLTNSVSPQK